MQKFLALIFVFVVGAAAPAFARASNASLLGTYVYSGTDTDGSKYDGDGALAITMDKSGALELKWDGGKYVGIGQVVGENQLAVASSAEGRVVIMLMEVKPDGSLEGKWWRRTDAGTKGTEIWKKK